MISLYERAVKADEIITWLLIKEIMLLFSSFDVNFQNISQIATMTRRFYLFCIIVKRDVFFNNQYT